MNKVANIDPMVRAEAELAMTIGTVTMAWNNLQDECRTIAIIAASASGSDFMLTQKTLDVVGQNDKIMRKLSHLTVEHFLQGKFTKIVEEFRVILKSIDRISERRNAFVHSSWSVENNNPDLIKPNDFNKRAHGATTPDPVMEQMMSLLVEMQKLRTEVRNLTLRVQDACRQIVAK